MVGEHCIFDRDAVLKDTVGTEHLPDILEEFGEFEDMYDIDHLEDSTDDEAARQEYLDIQTPLLTMMKEARVEEEMEISFELLSIDDPVDERTIESIYTFERVQELYMGANDLNEFEEFYEVYIRDFMELETNRTSRTDFVNQLNYTCT